MLDKKVEMWYNNKFSARIEGERADQKRKREFPLSVFYRGRVSKHCGK